MRREDLTSLRQTADHLAGVAGRLLDGVEELQRRLSAFEDEATEQREAQAKIRHLSEQRRGRAS